MEIHSQRFMKRCGVIRPHQRRINPLNEPVPAPPNASRVYRDNRSAAQDIYEENHEWPDNETPANGVLLRDWPGDFRWLFHASESTPSIGLRQAWEKLQAPTSKLQRSAKFQTPSWMLVLGCSLDVGAWCLELKKGDSFWEPVFSWRR
jgi:hypothetical protein